MVALANPTFSAFVLLLSVTLCYGVRTVNGVYSLCAVTLTFRLQAAGTFPTSVQCAY